MSGEQAADDVTLSGRVPHPKYILAAVGLASLFVMPAVLSTFHLFVLGSICFMVTFTISWDFFTGSTGYFNFAHMVIVGLAGYSSALLHTELGYGLIISILAATAIAGAFGTIVIAGPTLRLSGIYFAALTFILPVYAKEVVVLFGDITGGLPGYLYISPLGPRLSELVPLNVSGDLLLYYTSVILFTLALAGFVVLSKSQFGSVLRAIRQDELLLSSIGINPTKFKIAGFAITAVVAGFAGSVWTHFLVTLTPATQLSIQNMVDIVIAATIGGIGTIVGPAIGMFLIKFIDQGVVILQNEVIGQPFGIALVEYRRGFTLIVALLFFYVYPSGLYPAIRRQLDKLTSGSGDGQLDRLTSSSGEGED
ncbi:branched-chain amino acid ABC transporter permease [Halorarius litoreus]|uniref:branched-chain amino acid ABC transporter permease n=1 Tax=Halorarius litoreus TaxID=2962676 RepID=UPI0020CFB75A|nr:branched-chain amino acid ABC transporter permease [Halorarius litoreus]